VVLRDIVVLRSRPVSATPLLTGIVEILPGVELNQPHTNAKGRQKCVPDYRFARVGSPSRTVRKPR
jgi:hypothetical protein